MAELYASPITATYPAPGGYVRATVEVLVPTLNAADEWFRVYGMSAIIAIEGCILIGTAVTANVPCFRVDRDGTGGVANAGSVAIEGDAPQTWQVTVLGLP